MRVITKKIWPEFFEKVKSRKKNFEIRLADFKVSAGDVLVLREWSPKKKVYTGRLIRRKVRGACKVNVFKFYSPKELKKYSLLVIELK